jgi:hypothetical protein
MLMDLSLQDGSEADKSGLQRPLVIPDKHEAEPIICYINEHTVKLLEDRRIRE